MGKQLIPPAVQTPPAGDQANSVVQGTFTAVGIGLPFSVYGYFNMTLWGSVATSLTTTAASANASVVSGSGISVGMTVTSVNVPAGTTWLTFSGTSGTLAFPPGHTSAEVVTGTDAAATFAAVAVAATVQLERTHDGGSTWLIAGVGGGGLQAIYVNPQAFTVGTNESERGISYRLNCTAYSSGTLNYRLAGTSLARTTYGPV